MYFTPPMQSSRIRYSIMKEPLFISSWQMLNHRDSTAPSLLQHTGKGQFLVSSIVLVDTSYRKMYTVTQRRRKICLSPFLWHYHSHLTTVIYNIHILTGFPIFFPITLKQVYFSLPQRKANSF